MVGPKTIVASCLFRSDCIHFSVESVRSTDNLYLSFCVVNFSFPEIEAVAPEVTTGPED